MAHSPGQSLSSISESQRSSKRKYGRVCVCGKHGECQGVSAAFKLMGDPRKGYVQLPLYQEFPSSPIAKELNGLRAAYLRHFRKSEQAIAHLEEPLFVALHHFHPIVVQKHAESSKSTSPIPKTLKPVDVKFLKMKLGEEDRVLDADGRPTKLYYFVPNYSIEKAKEDLKRLIRVSRMVSESAPTTPRTPRPIVATPPPPPKRVPDAGQSTREVAEPQVLQEEKKEPAKEEEEKQRKQQDEKAVEDAEAETDSKDMIVTPAGPDTPAWEKVGEEMSDDQDLSLPTLSHPKLLDRVPEPEENRSPEEIVEEMVSFELRRREKFHEQVEEAASEWKSTLAVVQAGIYETARAERFVKSAAIANKAYADAMLAIAEDVFLDDDFNDVNSERKQNRIRAQRQIHESDEDDSRMLGSVDKYHKQISQMFSQVAKKILEEPVAELMALRKDLKTKLVEVKRQGDSFIRNLRAAETEVLQAWRAYDKVGMVVVSQDMLGTSVHSAHSVTSDISGLSSSQHGSTTSPKPDKGSDKPTKSQKNFFSRSPSESASLPAVDENTNTAAPWKPVGVDAWEHDSKRTLSSPLAAAFRSLGDVQDRWLAEWFYRIAVDRQASIWDICSGQLEKLNRTVREYEVNRQIRVHQLLLEFLPRERRLYLAVAPLSKPVLNDLVSQLDTRAKMETQVEDKVQKAMQKTLRNDFAQRSSIMNRSRALIPKLDQSLETLSGKFFDNGLLKASKVLERKTGVYGSWKTTLVVVTADKIMHLFDLSNYPQYAIGSSTSGILDTLAPDCQVPTMEKYVPARSDPILKDLTPADSINLEMSTLQIDGQDPRCLEVSVAISGRFSNVRKYVLRSTGREETIQWKNILNELGGYTDEQPNPTVVGSS